MIFPIYNDEECITNYRPNHAPVYVIFNTKEGRLIFKFPVDLMK